MADWRDTRIGELLEEAEGDLFDGTKVVITLAQIAEALLDAENDADVELSPAFVGAVQRFVDDVRQLVDVQVLVIDDADAEGDDPNVLLEDSDDILGSEGDDA